MKKGFAFEYEFSFNNTARHEIADVSILEEG